MNNHLQTTRRPPTKLGTVEDVSGSSIRVKLDDTTATGLVFVLGEGYRVGQVGSFVRIPCGYVDLFGVVTQVGAGASPGPPENAPAYGNRWLSIELVGEGSRTTKFERGISRYPTIGDPVHLVTERDLRGIYSPGTENTYIELGRIASAESLPAYVDANKLVMRHCALVGSTGSGKSTTVASVISALTDPDRFPSSRVVLIDIHGEYSKAFGDSAKVFRVNANEENGECPLNVPFWALNSEELIKLAIGQLNPSHLATITEAITDLRKKSKPAGLSHAFTDDATADTPVPFSIHDLWYKLHLSRYAIHSEQSANQSYDSIAWAEDPESNPSVLGDIDSVVRPCFKPLTKTGNDKTYKAELANDMRPQIDALEAKLKDSRYEFLFKSGKWAVDKNGITESDLDGLLDDWLGTEKPITVLDLSGIPQSVLSDLVGVILRIIYEAMFWGRHCQSGSRNCPVLICLEEAHSYLQSTGQSRAADSARRIAKEGRKYGVGLMLISQRPSELDSTILSQCGTMIAMRLTNESDQSQIRSCTSDSLGGLMSMLPVLRTGECIITGEAVGLPVRALITAPPKSRRPDGNDPQVVPIFDEGEQPQSTGWIAPIENEDFDKVIWRWRSQDAQAEITTTDTTDTQQT